MNRYLNPRNYVTVWVTRVKHELNKNNLTGLGEGKDATVQNLTIKGINPLMQIPTLLKLVSFFCKTVVKVIKEVEIEANLYIYLKEL